MPAPLSSIQTNASEGQNNIHRSIGIMLLFRDIKPDNLLLDARGHVKLSGDFYNHHDHLDYYRSSEIIIILNITIYIRFWAVHGAEEVSQN